MTKNVRVERDVPMAARDGVILRSDLYRPDDDGRYPSILIRTPYNKLQAQYNDMWRAVDFAFRDYVVVIQDARGRFASEGEFGTDRGEGPDGYDAVEWVASQPWCNGRVGMAGGSYVGSTQWQAAVLSPPSLQAIAPAIIGSNPNGSRFPGGALTLDRTVSWFPFMAVDMLAKLESQGKASPEMRQSVYRAVFNIEELYNFLPLREMKSQFPGLPGNMFNVLEHPSPDDPLWQNQPGEWTWETVKVPGLHTGGWYDLFTEGTINNWESMQAKGGSARAKGGQHLLMGPWAHGALLPSIVGGMHFGPNASGAPGQIVQHHLRFYDRYLKDMDIALPAVRYFVMGANRWRNAETWPLPETEWQRFYLRSKGRANTSAGDGWLSGEEPSSEPPDVFTYDPRFPVPTVGGRNLGAGRLVLGPFDQTRVEQRHDVLVYSTPVLEQDLEVTGPLKLHLFAATNARDTDFVAKLADVLPDGESINVAEGIIRARFWKSGQQADLVNPGEIREYVIDLAAASNVFKKGHRIRLDVTSSNFPAFDRNMNTGQPIGTDVAGIPAVQTILHETGHTSYIDLPVIPIRS